MSEEKGIMETSDFPLMDTIKPLRVCRECGLEAYTEEDLELFKLHEECKNGKANICKICDSEHARKNYTVNRLKRREVQKKYRETNREKMKERNEKYYEENHETLKGYARKHYDANSEDINKRKKINYQINSKKVKEQQKNYRKINPFLFTLKSAKRRAEERGISFNLEKDFLKKLWNDCNGICTMTGVSMLQTSKVNDPLTMSLDRINPEKGYVKGNVRFVSRWYNVSRSNWGDSFTREMCQRVIDNVSMEVK